MSFFTRLLLAVCIFAGMANGLVHKASHDPHDECAAQHSHGSSHDSHDDGDSPDAPHHHDCCHFPNADCALDHVSAAVSFRHILVEIPADVTLAPDEPVYALDKPPLI